MPLRVAPNVFIDENDLVWRFTRASGPGGQNVNKVATAVRLRFDVIHAGGLPEPVRQRLIRIAGSRMTDEGVLVIEAGRFRSRERNKQDALERLFALVLRAAEEPRPRRKTRPGPAARQRRLDAKTRRARLKRSRGRGSFED